MAWTFALIGGTATIAGGFQGILTTDNKLFEFFLVHFYDVCRNGNHIFFRKKQTAKGISLDYCISNYSNDPFSNCDCKFFLGYFSLAAGSAVMIFLFVYIFEFMYKNRSISSGILNYLLFLMFAYALMMVGQFIWLLSGDASIFALSIIVEMGVYFVIVLDEKRLISSEPKRWLSMRYWVFGVLVLLSIAEFFMGAALDIQAYGTSYFTGIAFASTSGSFFQILRRGVLQFHNFLFHDFAVPLVPDNDGH